MARTVTPLNMTQIKNAKPKDKTYSLRDGGGLLLQINPNGSKIWQFDYKRPITKKRNTLSLGAFPEIELATVREIREKYRTLLAQNIDPQIYRENVKVDNEEREKNTFKHICKRWFDEIYPTKAQNPETIKKNWARLEKHIFPTIGDSPIGDIKPYLLVSLYRAIGASNTLDKLHRLVKSTLDYAIKLGVIESHNCDIAKDDFTAPIARNQPSIAPEELPALIKMMNDAFDAGRIEFNTFYAFNLTLLIGLRQSELTRLEWSHIDEDNKQIIVPSHLLKQTRKLKEQPRDHIIPLSKQTRAILLTIARVNGASNYLFPATRKRNKPMSRESVSKALRDILAGTPFEGKQNAHGLRSIFRTYLTQKGVDPIVGELALAHVSAGRDKTQAAYDRYEYLKERAQALQIIGDYCEQSGIRLTL